MPPKLKIGSVVQGQRGRYRTEVEIADGNMSWAFRATQVETGEAVFLKYYKSPTPTVSWYQAYLNYMARLNARLTESTAAQYCVLARDLFTANPKPGMCTSEFFFSTYDFIEGGHDLRKWMDSEHTSWEKRKAIAKVFLSSMKKIHEAKVVHCDLKPENVQMLPDSNTRLGLIPRMIDMDFSIMADEPAPWTTGADKQGYTGTPGYFSPEHLRGEAPVTASDVFTIALILGELLGGVHPFAAHNNGQDDYKQAVLAGGKYTPIKLLGSLGAQPENADTYARLLEKCLDPVAPRRPSCAELHQQLLALDRGAGSAPVPVTPSAPVPEAAPAPEPEVKHNVLCLKGDNGVLKVRIGMGLGSTSLGAASTQARLAMREQFVVSKEGNTWFIAPAAGAVRNLTALDGTPLTERTELKEDSTVCLMGKTSGKTAMHLKVSFE